MFLQHGGTREGNGHLRCPNYQNVNQELSTHLHKTTLLQLNDLNKHANFLKRFAGWIQKYYFIKLFMFEKIPVQIWEPNIHRVISNLQIWLQRFFLQDGQVQIADDNTGKGERKRTKS